MGWGSEKNGQTVTLTHGGRSRVLHSQGGGDTGVAAVYRVRDTSVGGELAVKVLDPEKSAKRALSSAFISTAWR